MSYTSFLGITPKEFYLALLDKSKYDGMVAEINVRMICETIRSQTTHLLNIQLKRGSRINDEKKLIRFPWDMEKDNLPQTKEQMINAMKAIAQVYKK